jgi:hypothetical protein
MTYGDMLDDEEAFQRAVCAARKANPGAQQHANVLLVLLRTVHQRASEMSHRRRTSLPA